MDSHASRIEYTEEEGEYDYFKSSQVTWAQTHLNNDTTDSVFFFHIPLRQYMEAVTYNGIWNEKVCPQGKDTGLFDIMVSVGKTKGVFVGHDHLNNYDFTLDGILLAYGQITGYSAYGDLPRGGRVIEISKEGLMQSYIILETEVTPS